MFYQASLTYIRAAQRNQFKQILPTCLQLQMFSNETHTHHQQASSPCNDLLFREPIELARPEGHEDPALAGELKES